MQVLLQSVQKFCMETSRFYGIAYSGLMRTPNGAVINGRFYSKSGKECSIILTITTSKVETRLYEGGNRGAKLLHSKGVSNIYDDTVFIEYIQRLIRR